MSAVFWLRQIGLMLWLETIADRRKFIARTIVFAIFAALFWLIFAVSVSTISQANQSLGGVYMRMAQGQAHNTGSAPIKVPDVDGKYLISEETSKILLKLIRSGSSHQQEYNPPVASPRTVDERLKNAAYEAEHELEKFKTAPRMQVYTNDPQLWPAHVRAQVEKMFGPLKTADEEAYLNGVQKNGNAWIQVRKNSEGQLQWRGWGPESFLDTKFDTQPQILNSYINAVGRVYQTHYLDEVQASEEYQNLPNWYATMFPTFAPIDVRALSLFLILAVFVFPTLLAASQAITWDFNRNKNVYEPYATMKIPVWGVLLKESLSGFWYLVVWAVITALLCGLVVSHDLSYWIFLVGMISLGLAGCWLNLQINMFLVVTFQTPVGRQLARVLVMPFFFLPYHLFRVFGATEILKILDGKSLQEFNWMWMWGATVVCVVLGVAILRLGAWRVGRYRKGLAPS